MNLLKIIFIIFPLFSYCKAVRDSSINKVKPEPTEEYRTFKLHVVCERKVNQVSFDFPLSECEEARDTLKTSFQNINGWYIAESGKPGYFFFIYLEESETHSKIWDFINTISFGIVPYFATLEIKIKLEIFNRKGEVVFQKTAKEKIEITWHLFYAFHAPFMNPDSVIREALKDMGYSLIQ